MSTLPEAIEHIRNGKMVILVDDEERENEGDLVIAADFITPEAINFLATHARGLICLSMEGTRIDELQLPMMAQRNRSSRQTAFTVSIEASKGVTTGISAADRSHTIRVAVDPATKPKDLISPGHVFPLRAVEGGVLVRAGHTEGSIDLCRLAGLKPAAVICEIMNADGTMARMQDLKKFSQDHGNIPIITIQELIAYRMSQESSIVKIAEAKFPSKYGEFQLTAYRNKIDGTEHIALHRGPLENPVMVRVHSECLTGDALGSLRCDCGSQLDAALKQIAESRNGILVYMRSQEGRGIGLANKVKAYSLQDDGMDTVEANKHLGFKADLRHYGIGAQILRSLGVTQIRLLTNNPKKVVGLGGYGLEILETIPIETPTNPHNIDYLTTKRDKLGHKLNLHQGERLH